MITTKQKSKIFDIVQKVWVSTCIAVTLGASGYIGVSLYHYFTKIKPIKQELEKSFKEELLKEGRMKMEQIRIPTN